MSGHDTRWLHTATVDEGWATFALVSPGMNLARRTYEGGARTPPSSVAQYGQTLLCGEVAARQYHQTAILRHTRATREQELQLQEVG